MGRFNGNSRGRGFGRGGRGRGRGGGRGRGRGGGRGRGKTNFGRQEDAGCFGSEEGLTGGRLGILPEEQMSYYRNVYDTLNSGFAVEEEENNVKESEEAKEEFLSNVFSVFREEAIQVSQNQTVSWIIESLFAQAHPQHLRSVLGPFCGELTLVFFDRFASHVMQALVEYLPAIYEYVCSADSEGKAEEFKSQVEKLCGFTESHLRDIMTHTYGSHVLRSLLEALSGVKVTEQVVQQKRGKGSMSKKLKVLSPLLDYSKYPSFSKDYKSWFQTLKEKIIRLCNYTDHLDDLSYTPVLQTVLLILNKSSLEEYKELAGTIIERSCLNRSEDTTSHDPTERLPHIVQSDQGSYLFELLLTLADKKELHNIYKQVFSEKIMYFCLHSHANYVLQTLMASVTEEALVCAILDEISQYFEDILAVNHPGIIIKLASACQRAGVGQEKFLELLMSAFHCHEPKERQMKVVPLIASFKTYEMLFDKEEDAEEKEEKKSSHLTDLILPGTLLLQQLLQFSLPGVLVVSLLDLSATELAHLATHQSGSHVVDSFFSSPSIKDKDKDTFVKKLVGMYTQLAISKHGSRCLENVWKESSVAQRILIAEDLTKQVDRLESDFYGKFICFKFGLYKFTHRRQEWLQLQGASTKKQRILKEVLKGSLKKNEKKRLDREKESNLQVDSRLSEPLTAESTDGGVSDSKTAEKKRKDKKKRTEAVEEMSKEEDELNTEDDTDVKSKKRKRKKEKKRTIREQDDEDTDVVSVKVIKDRTLKGEEGDDEDGALVKKAKNRKTHQGSETEQSDATEQKIAKKKKKKHKIREQDDEDTDDVSVKVNKDKRLKAEEGKDEDGALVKKGKKRKTHQDSETEQSDAIEQKITMKKKEKNRKLREEDGEETDVVSMKVKKDKALKGEDEDGALVRKERKRKTNQGSETEQRDAIEQKMDKKKKKNVSESEENIVETDETKFPDSRIEHGVTEKVKKKKRKATS